VAPKGGENSRPGLGAEVEAGPRDVAKGEEGLVLSPESSKPTADHCSIRRVAFAVSRCMHYADLCVSWVS